MQRSDDATAAAAAAAAAAVNDGGVAAGHEAVYAVAASWLNVIVIDTFDAGDAIAEIKKQSPQHSSFSRGMRSSLK